MLVHVVSDEHIRVEVDGNDGLEIHGEAFGPLQMLATSLALCSASVMQDYAATAQFHLHHFAIEIKWEYVEQPYRVGQMHMALLVGDDVPPSRHKALLRAAEHHCTVHNTLTHATHIHTTLEASDAEQA